MRLETVRIHFLRDVFGLLSSRNFATMDVTTSPLYSVIKMLTLLTVLGDIKHPCRYKKKCRIEEPIQS